MTFARGCGMIVGEDSGTMENDKKEKRYPPPRIRVGPGSISIVDVDAYARSEAVQDDVKKMMKVDFTRPRKKSNGSS